MELNVAAGAGFNLLDPRIPLDALLSYCSLSETLMLMGVSQELLSSSRRLGKATVFLYWRRTAKSSVKERIHFMQRAIISWHSRVSFSQYF